MPLLVTTTPLPVLKMVSMPPSFACPQKLVFPALGWTLHTHSNSVPARAHLQPHRAQTLQSCPIILRPGQGVQGPVRVQTAVPFGSTCRFAPVPAAVPAVTVALYTLQRVL